MTKAFSVLAPIPLFPPTSKKSLDVLWAKQRRGGGELRFTKDADETWTVVFERGNGEVHFV